MKKRAREEEEMDRSAPLGQAPTVIGRFHGHAPFAECVLSPSWVTHVKCVCESLQALTRLPLTGTSVPPQNSTVLDLSHAVEQLLHPGTAELRCRSMGEIGVWARNAFSSVYQQTESSPLQADPNNAVVVVALFYVMRNLLVRVLFDHTLRVLHRAAASTLRSVFISSSQPHFLAEAAVVLGLRSDTTNVFDGCDFASNAAWKPLVAAEMTQQLRTTISDYTKLEKLFTTTAEDDMEAVSWALNISNTVETMLVGVASIAAQVVFAHACPLVRLVSRALEISVRAVSCESAKNEASSVHCERDSSDPFNVPSDCKQRPVFGEVLDRVRFIARVAATLTHRCIRPLRDALCHLQECRATEGEDPCVALALQCHAALAVLSSYQYTKDMTNSAALLFITVITLTTTNDAELLHALCHTAAAALPGQKWDDASHPRLMPSLDLVQRALNTIYTRKGGRLSVFADLIGVMTPNGVFATFKGLLAHCANPPSQDEDRAQAAGPTTASLENAGVGVLLRGPQFIAIDIILPAAQLYVDCLAMPDTRFMALQTVDAVVRHIEQVATWCEAARSKQKGKGAAACPMPSFLSSPRVLDALGVASEIILSLWEDPTQQVSGPLCDTYRSLVQARALLEAASQLSTTATSGAGLRLQDALTAVLSMSVDRRGKYHALVALMDVLPVSNLIQAVIGTSNVVDLTNPSPQTMQVVARQFVQPLLAASVNSKVCGAAGDVFVAFARKLDAWLVGAPPKKGAPTPSDSPPQRSPLWQCWVVDPIALCLVGIKERQPELCSWCLSHVAAPLLKKFPRELSSILGAVTTHPDSELRTQAVVELLLRARNSGCDISEYLVPPSNGSSEKSVVRQILKEALQSAHYDVVNTALNLCCHATRPTDRVEKWSCAVMEEQVRLGASFGGVSTHRNNYLRSFDRWQLRLLESAIFAVKIERGKPTPNITATTSETIWRHKREHNIESPARDYVDEVCNHNVRLAQIVHPVFLHVGFATDRKYTALRTLTSILTTLKNMHTSLGRNIKKGS